MRLRRKKQSPVMKRILVTLSLLIATGAELSGCATLNPHRLEDTLANYHDDLRWGRTQVAERSIQTELRAEWSRRHANWLERIRIVDMEVEQPRTREGHTFVRANFTWNFADEVETRETTIETRWIAGPIDWTCDEESVISGDRRLLAISAPPSPRPSGQSSGEAPSAEGLGSGASSAGSVSSGGSASLQ